MKTVTDNFITGDRLYYDPVAFCKDALDRSRPIIFASINYRLGALGFLHCPEAAEYLPSNNGYVKRKPIRAPRNGQLLTTLVATGFPMAA